MDDSSRRERRERSSETLKRYLQEISRLPRISPDEEKQLARRIARGDRKALRRLRPRQLASIEDLIYRNK